MITQPVDASALASPSLLQGASVKFDSSDHSICVYQSSTITATGTVTLPQGVSALLQTQFFIKNPPDLSTVNNPVYDYIPNVTNGSKFTVTGQWPGIRPTDTVVEIHFGAILLDPTTQEPISSGTGLDIYWYPYVCTVPPVVTNTPVTPSPTTPAADTPTATATASDTPTLTFTPTITNTLPPGVTPTLTDTPAATSTPTATSTEPVGVTPTITNTVPVGVTPTVTNTPVSPTTTSTAPSGVTPSPTSPSGATPTTPSGATATPLATLPAPAATGTPSALIPVTGADLTGQITPANLHQRVFLDAGVALLGLAFVFHGFSLKEKRH